MSKPPAIVEWENSVSGMSVDAQPTECGGLRIVMTVSKPNNTTPTLREAAEALMSYAEQTEWEQQILFGGGL